MRKLAQLAVIVAASVLTIMSAVGGADLLGPAHADGPQCIANATDPCPPQADPPQSRPAPASDCLHWWGAEDRRSSVPASASTPHQRAALTARQRYCASTAYRCQPTTLTVAGTRATLTK
jgi:hypothetical protein